jgi:hypothetical protein
MTTVISRESYLILLAAPVVERTFDLWLSDRNARRFRSRRHGSWARSVSGYRCVPHTIHRGLHSGNDVPKPIGLTRPELNGAGRRSGRAEASLMVNCDAGGGLEYTHNSRRADAGSDFETLSTYP